MMIAYFEKIRMRMEFSKKLICLFIVATTLFWGCESLSLDEKVEDYPVFIKRIPISDLQTMNEQYHEKNNGLICSTLNEYGYTGFSRVLFPNDVNPCLNRNQIKEEQEFRSDLIEEVKSQLSDNSEYTGVINSEELIIKEIISLDGCTICEGPNINNVPLQWKFTFQPQFVNGIEVESTELVAYLDVNGINRIWGNWYQITDPGFIEFGSNNALKEVVGLKLEYVNSKNQMFEQEILAEHILEKPSLKYSPIKTEEGIEIHKVWIVNIIQENTDTIRWQVYLSTISGEILNIREL